MSLSAIETALAVGWKTKSKPEAWFTLSEKGDVAKWLGRGLQNLERRFESGRHLHQKWKKTPSNTRKKGHFMTPSLKKSSNNPLDLSTEQAFSKHQSLKAEIEKHNHHYYVLNESLISDQQFDALFAELKQLEDDFPHLVTKDSPTQRVGGTVAPEFQKRRHKTPMLSLSNSYSPQELLDFDKRIKKFLSLSADEDMEYFCQLKFDGVSVDLVYEEGLLVRAMTRGDGQVGEDITENIKTIKSIPLKLRRPVTFLEARGEVLFTHHNFLKLNEMQVEMGLPLFSNPRNAASGSIRQLDPSITARRPLSFFAYGCGLIDFKEKPSTQSALELLLLDFGLPCLNIAPALSGLKPQTRSLSFVASSIQDVVDYYKVTDKLRDRIPFDIDGIVVKVNSMERQEQLGTLPRHPRWATATKFKALNVSTQIKDIVIQVGRTGALTPVAILEPVQIEGVTVQQATLHNQDEISKKDIRIGDTVVLERAGDVIPAILEVLKEKRPKSAQVFQIPSCCPVCLTEVIKEEVVYRCLNAQCKGRFKALLRHFISKKAMNIDGMGDRLIEQLVEKNKVQCFSDIYRLTKDDLLSLDKQGDKSSQIILEQIEKSKPVRLDKFVFALGLRHVGEQTAKLLAQHYQNIEDILKASCESLIQIEGIGPVVAESFVKEVSGDLLKEVQALLKVGVQIQPYQAPSQGVQKSIVITGVLPQPRHQVKVLLEKQGFQVKSSLSSKTDYLLVGEKVGSKKKKAEALGVQVLTWDNLNQMIDNSSVLEVSK